MNYRAPLRFLFGWIVYVALWHGVWPAVYVAYRTIVDNPLAGTIALTIGGLLFIPVYVFVLTPFWRWSDKPRATAPQCTPVR